MCRASEASDKPSVGPSWADVGNMTHFVTLAVVGVHAGAVMAYGKEGNTFFDPSWMEDGFCVANKETPYFNSHDLCLYGDTIFSVILAILYFALRKSPGMEAANELVMNNIPGILVHGFGHGHLAKTMRDGAIDDDISLSSMDTTLKGLEIADLLSKVIPPLLVFWLPLLKATMPNVSWLKVAPLVVAAGYFQLIVPRLFGFTYVQTVLLIAFAINQTVRPRDEKGFEYGLYPLIVGFPLGIIGWLECMACDSIMKPLYGHIVYDYWIAISIIVFYVICYTRARSSSPKTKVE